MKDKKERVIETAEQKEARWSKQAKQARAFGKMCGFNAKALAGERNRYANERRKFEY
jgi:hypothetical protein